MRIAALLLVVSLAGPSTTALICDWACADRHEQATTSSGCHDQHGSQPSFGPGGACHELSVTSSSVPVPSAQGSITAFLHTQDGLSLSASPGRGRTSAQPAGVSHAPPLVLTPLRI